MQNGSDLNAQTKNHETPYGMSISVSLSASQFDRAQMGLGVNKHE